MLIKPICLIKVDESFVPADKRNEVTNNLSLMMPDYYVLVCPTYNNESDPVQVQVFHEKDFTEIQYEELKNLIIDNLPKHE